VKKERELNLEELVGHIEIVAQKYRTGISNPDELKKDMETVLEWIRRLRLFHHRISMLAGAISHKVLPVEPMDCPKDRLEPYFKELTPHRDCDDETPEPAINRVKLPGDCDDHTPEPNQGKVNLP
jgi:hypothetical protein